MAESFKVSTRSRIESTDVKSGAFKASSSQARQREVTSKYKITNGLVEVAQEYHPAPRLQNTTRGHNMQFQRFQPVVDAFKYAFLPQTIPAWNALPQLHSEP